MIALPMQQYHAATTLHLGSSSWRRIKDTGIPPRGKVNGLYVNNSLARTEAIMNGYDDALILTEDGFVSEGSTSNIIIVRNGILITPPPYMDILEGITLDSVGKIANSLGKTVQVRPIHRSEVYIADEVFLCGTAAEIRPVTRVDNRVISEGKLGPITKKIQDMFARIVRGHEPDLRHWLEPVS